MECLRTHFQKGVVLNGRYETENALNHGSFGMVFVARDTKTGNQVAVKILTKRSAVPEGENSAFAIDDASEELEFHELLGQHRNTVNLIDNFETESHVYLVLEFCEHGDLYEAIRTGMGPLSTAEVKDFMLQLIDGVEYMHSKGLFHRDIKPENIFLCKDGSVKLGDFGLATKRTWCWETTVGSDRYMAPEQYDSAGAGYDPAQADIWAIGVILLNVLFSKNPFIKPTMEDPIFLDYSRDGQSLFDVFTDMSQDTFDVILACMSLDPKKRSITAVRDAINRVEAFTDGFDDNDDYCRPTTRPPPIVTANREPLRTPTIKSATVENGVAFPWQKALEATPAQAIRQLSAVPEDNLSMSYSEDLFAKSSRDWSYVKVATPGTSMTESSLGQSLFSNYNAPAPRPTLKKLPSLLPISGSLPINMAKSKAMASVFGKKETVAKSWSEMWDEDEEEEENVIDRKMMNNARTFSNEKIDVDSDESAVVFEEDEEAVVLIVKAPSAININIQRPTPQVEQREEDYRFNAIDDENAIDNFFFQSKPTKPVACPFKAEKNRPAIYSPPAKRTSDAADKWAALGARRRGLTGESMPRPPTSWRIQKSNVGMRDGNGNGSGSLNAGVWDHKPAATGGVHYNHKSNHNKANKGWVQGLDQQHGQSPINFSRNHKSTFQRKEMKGMMEGQENVDHTARDMHLDGDVGDLEWVGGWGDKVAGLQL